MSDIKIKNTEYLVLNPKYIEALTEDEWELDYDESECENIDEYLEKQERCKTIKKIITRLCGKPTPLGVGVSENKK